MEETKLSAEHEELTQQIAALQAVMDQDQRVYQVIVQETQQLKKKHGRPRQSVISDEQADLSEEDLLVNGRCVHAFTLTDADVDTDVDTDTAITICGYGVSLFQ